MKSFLVSVFLLAATSAVCYAETNEAICEGICFKSITAAQLQREYRLGVPKEQLDVARKYCIVTETAKGRTYGFAYPMNDGQICDEAFISNASVGMVPIIGANKP